VTLPILRDAPWLNAPSTRAVLDALAASGFPARIVGGAVRNTLIGIPVADVDIATPATPTEVIAACARARLETIATGLEHGTVTVVAAHRPIEVTTLRRDVSTDGRRATVAFTADWAEDARRRDFTMNALYCDAEGRLYDDVGGCADLLARRVRFIGNADQRIAEDYLRILRFFRFHAAFADGPPDPEAMAASARGLAGMGRLSAERIRAELMKLLVAPRAGDAVHAMADIGLLPLLLGAAPRIGVLDSLVAAERSLAQPPEATLRLSALALAVADDVPRISARLRLSKAERQALVVMDTALCQTLVGLDAAGARRLVYRKGREQALRLAVALLAVAPDAGIEARRIATVATTWTPPVLPVSGADVVRSGIPPGRVVGECLARLEDWWISEDFPDEAAVRAELTRRIGGMKP
jgi:poly(A) polymerase